MIRDIEERSLNAWPGLGQLFNDGWVLRFSGGFTRRANCVNILSHSNESVEEKIAWCESQYRDHELPTVFKITPLTLKIDELLEKRGYEREAETEVQCLQRSDFNVSPQDKSGIKVVSYKEWIDAFAHFVTDSPEILAIHKSILQAIVPETCYAVMYREGTPISVGIGVLERGMLGIYNLITGENHRRQNCASRILSKIFNWASERGAHSAYLQVMYANEPAMNLYSKLGFKKCYGYWYRVKGK